MAMLYVIATPIGNRSDLSARAMETLTAVDLIVSEKPLASKKLLDPLGIRAKLIPMYEPGKQFATPAVLAALRQGHDVALISEAGTPGINDPGGVIVAAVRAATTANSDQLHIRAIPGPNAAIAAASISGFPMDEFVYKGFVPHKKGRETFFANLVEIEPVVIFYESPHRIDKTLAALGVNLPDRYLCIARELTKLHEQSLVTTCQKAALLSASELPRLGEFVLVLAPRNFVPQDKETHA